MTEHLVEQIVKRNETRAVKVKKAILIVLTVLSVPFFFPAITIIMLLVDVFLFGRMSVEYEYTFFEGDFAIDRVTNKATRRRMFAVKLKDVDVIAQANAPELRGYQHIKALNFSTKIKGNQTYELVAKQGSEKVRVIFEPNEKLLEEMRRIEPRKVFL